MNKNINLCEILKGHEGETFYSPAYGEVVLEKALIGGPIITRVEGSGQLSFNSNGVVLFTKGECMLFPSKDQRDWNKWDKENNHKTPKIWSDIEDIINNTTIAIEHLSASLPIIKDDKVVKSALAFLKIHQLIKVSYGGNAIDKSKEFYSILYDVQDKDFIIRGYKAVVYDNFILAFHTIDQAKEFLRYPENIQLLKDYFMV